MVAEDTPSPLSWASTCDDTGSPVSMYSRTSVASSRRERSERSKELISGQKVTSRPSDYSQAPKGRPCPLAPLFLERAFPAHRDGGDVRLGDLAVLHGDQLGQDAHGNLLRRNRADVEANRRMNPRQRFGGGPFFAERVEDPPHLGLAADQPHI